MRKLLHLILILRWFAQARLTLTLQIFDFISKLFYILYWTSFGLVLRKTYQFLGKEISC